MPPLITILSTVLIASYCCYALPQPMDTTSMDAPLDNMGTSMNQPMNTGVPSSPAATPTSGGSSSAAAAAAAAASSSGNSNGQNPSPNCSPPPFNPCPSPPPPFNPSPCPSPPPPFNPSPCPSPPPINPCPPPHPPSPNCSPSSHPPSPNCPTPNGGTSGSSSASAAASASASTGTGNGSGSSAASASASASATTTVKVPNLQQICSYPTDVQQCSQVYSLKYQHTEFQKLHNQVFYIHYASKSQQQFTFDSAPCFDFSCSQSCQTIMVKYLVESSVSITKVIWGSDSTGQLSYVKTAVKVISTEYAVMQDTFIEAQKVTSGSTTAVVSTQTQQLEQFISSSPYVLMYSDYEHILAMKRCSDSAMFVAVCETLYHNQQQLQSNAMSAIQSILSFHQIEVNSCSTLTQKFSLDINSISMTSASFDMTKTNDGTVISGNKIERTDGNSVMSGETSVSRTQSGDVSMSSSTSTSMSSGMSSTSPSPSPPPPPPSSSSGGTSTAASAAASASSSGSSS